MSRNPEENQGANALGSFAAAVGLIGLAALLAKGNLFGYNNESVPAPNQLPETPPAAVVTTTPAAPGVTELLRQQACAQHAKYPKIPLPPQIKC